MDFRVRLPGPKHTLPLSSTMTLGKLVNFLDFSVFPLYRMRFIATFKSKVYGDYWINDLFLQHFTHLSILVHSKHNHSEVVSFWWKRWIVREQRISRTVKVLHYNDGMSLYFCPDSQNAHQEWTLMYTTDFGWVWCVDVSSPFVKKHKTQKRLFW